jgi:branched-chain amino acid transport system ATP-binding protein
MLEVAGLSKHFGGLHAVRDASLSLAPGEILGLIGPNGAGKTTLFALISGFIRPDAGAVRLDGASITGLPPEAICARGLARTFQIVQPFGRLSVRENIAVGAHLHEPRRAAALAEAAAVAGRLGLADRLDQPARTLTLAGRKRLEVARALATRPRVLLLDEVMAGLNPSEVAALLPLVRAIAQSGVGIVMIEHVMQAVMQLCARVSVLNHGSVIASGSPAEIVADARVVEAYLGHGAAARLGRHVA